MNILHIVHNYYPSIGGSQDVFKSLSEGLTAQFGDEVTVFTTNALQSPNMLQAELIPHGEEVLNGVRVRRFPYWRKTLPVLKHVMRVARRRTTPLREYVETFCLGPIAPGMLLEVMRSRADVISCMAFPFLHMHYPRLAKRLGAPRRPVVHFGALHIHDGYIPRPVLAAVHKAQAYVAFTDFERDTLIEKGIPADRIHVVGLGIDVGRFDKADGRAIRERYGIGDAPVVGFIGRVAAYKGCDTLVQAMTDVWDRFPDAYLLIAGSRTAFAARLREMIEQLPRPKQEQVIVAEGFPDEEKPQWFAACDVFASVSQEESFGIVYLEAWACGKPVVGGRISAVECLIKAGENGLLVPCREPRPLSEAIISLLEDDRLRDRLGRSGQSKVFMNHDWPIVVAKIREIYEQVI